MHVSLVKKVSFCFILALFFSPLISSAAVFSRNLSQGAKGSDVTLLQKILNLSPETKILGTGAGSSGKETAFFGPATKEALIRFQNFYASEILTPAGLLKGTGYVGYYTLKKLEALAVGLAGQGSTTLPTQVVPPTTPITPPVSTSAPQTPTINPILSISTGKNPAIVSVTKKPTGLTPVTVKKASDGTPIFNNGDTLIVTGKNFASVNTVIVSSEVPIEGVPSATGTSLTFLLKLDMAAGLSQAFSNIPASVRGSVINSIVSKQAEKTTDPLLKDSLYNRVTITIENANGVSWSFPIFVNLLAEI
jgi:peptidoglycan hydrolase-like protein with peptidoglycan-binding domain